MDLIAPIACRGIFIRKDQLGASLGDEQKPFLMDRFGTLPPENGLHPRARVHRADDEIISVCKNGVGSPPSYAAHRAGRIDRVDPAIQRVVED